MMKTTKTTIRLGETTLERRGRPGWKELLPKEHGVWAWLGLPLVLALGLAPTVSTLLATGAVVIGFGAAQGWGRAMRGSRGAAVPTVIALLLANLFGLGAVASAVRPGVLVATLLGGGVVGLFGMSYLRGLAPRHVGFELAAIAGFVAIGAGIAVSGGADPSHTVAAALALGAWLVLGLWWIKRMLAAVLKHREPWANGVWFGAGAAGAEPGGRHRARLPVGGRAARPLWRAHDDQPPRDRRPRRQAHRPHRAGLGHRHRARGGVLVSHAAPRFRSLRRRFFCDSPRQGSAR